MWSLFHKERARVAVLSRFHSPDYPALVAARTRMREQVLVDAVAKALKRAPALTPVLRQRIDGLLDAAEAAE